MCRMDYKYRVCPCRRAGCPQSSSPGSQTVRVEGRAHHLDYPFPYDYLEQGSTVCELERYRTFDRSASASPMCRNFTLGFLHPEVIMVDTVCLKCVSCSSRP